MAIIGFDSSALLNYYATRLPQTGVRSTVSHTLRQTPPWDLSIKKVAQERAEAAARNSDPYFDPKDRSLFAKTDTGARSTARASGWGPAYRGADNGFAMAALSILGGSKRKYKVQSTKFKSATRG